MAQEKDSKDKLDKPSTVVVYAISAFIAFIVLMPISMGFTWLIKVSKFYSSSEFIVDTVSGLLLGLILTIAAAAVFGYFANKQIIDMKE